MGIVTKITTPGNNLTGSLNGRIILDEGRGRFVVTDQAGTERSVQDVEGTHVFDENGVERTTLNTSGIIGTRANGTRYAKLGQADIDGRDILAVAKTGIDLRDKGI